MKKKILALLLALTMLCAVLPLNRTAKAEDEAAFDAAAAYSYLLSLEEIEAEAYLTSLNEKELSAVADYVQTLQTVPAEPAEPPQTCVFTEAGPFLPPVKVTARKMMKAMGLGAAPDNGIETVSGVTVNTDGTYTLRLESWTTGSVTTVQTTNPVDITLVLDQSVSMAQSLGGTTRQAALKSSVNAFIDAVAEKYNAEKSDHRISVVTYANGASVAKGWTNADTTGAASLKSTINSLTLPTGTDYTDSDDGMSQAANLLNGTGYSYSGSNTTRQKVAILFTDGVPGTGDFDTTIADSTITYANALKAAGVTVYTVGIFNGADPDQLYGSKADYMDIAIAGIDDIPCNGGTTAPGFIWGATSIATYVSGGVSEVDVPAGNRFLNYISSNFASPDEIGIVRGVYDGKTVLGSTYYGFTIGGIKFFDDWRTDIHGFKITRNFERATTGYYLTASDESSLNSIFTTISENIESASTNLGADTAVEYVLPEDFLSLANAAASVTVKTAYYNGTSFGGDQYTTLTASVDDGTVTVTGFDFSANFVSDTLKSDGTYGSKLIVEICLKPVDNMDVGETSYTVDPDCGVYTFVEDEAVLVEAFPEAAINTVPITVKHETVNFGASAALREMENRYVLPYADYMASAKAYTGYSLRGANSQTLTDVTASSTLTFTYDENTATVTYTAGEHGSVSNASETVGVVSGSFAGSTATADTWYRFVGWYDGNGTLISSASVFVPTQKVNAAYTALFERKTASYTVRHWTQDGTSTSYSLQAEETLTGNVGDNTQAVTKLGQTGYEGFHISQSRPWAQTTVTEDGTAVVNIYYDRNLYDYTIRHLEAGTNTAIAEDTVLPGCYFGQTVTLADYARSVNGFTFSSCSPASDEVAVSGNTGILYYTRNSYTLTYTVFGGNSRTESVPYAAALSGYAYTPAETYYTFDGWYTDADCTVPWTMPDTMPAQAITVYGRMTRQTSALTITKTGMQAGENAIFMLTGEGLGSGLRIAVPGNSGSVTVTGLYCGAQYTVTEETGWSWRYTAQNASASFMPTEAGRTYSMTFANAAQNPAWLCGEAHKLNVFARAQRPADR